MTREDLRELASEYPGFRHIGNGNYFYRKTRIQYAADTGTFLARGENRRVVAEAPTLAGVLVKLKQCSPS